MPGRRPHHRDGVSLEAIAWVHVGRVFTAVLGLTFTAGAVWHHELRWLSAASLGGLGWLVFAILHAFQARQARCAVCTGFLFGDTGNVKHSSAGRFLGSYKLHTALQIIFKTSYRCHHCGTKVVLGYDQPHRKKDQKRTRSRGRRAPLPPPRHPRPGIVLHVNTTQGPKKERWRAEKRDPTP